MLSEKVTTWFKDHEELLQPSNFKASKTLVKGLVLSFLGVLCLAYLPWYCLPLGWFLLGAAQLGVRKPSPTPPSKKELLAPSQRRSWSAPTAS